MKPLSDELLAKVRRLHLRARRSIREHLAGRFRSHFRGAGLEFAEVREYQPGDDLRALDWNVTARTGKPHLKQFVEERELTVFLAIDVSASLQGLPRTVRQARDDLIALLALAAADANDRVGSLLFDDRVRRVHRPRNGFPHALRLVTEALDAKPSGQTTCLTQSLATVCQVVPRRSVLFLISDFETPEFGQALRVASHRHDLIGVHLSPPQEALSRARGLVRLREPESGAERWFDLSNRGVRERLLAAVAKRQSEVQEALAQAGAEHLLLDGREPAWQLLARLLATRAGAQR